ncbi:MAG: maleylpyruvate isomerase family mycothiol-dependent enzyme, partial [Pseudonocardia sp.]|nr:maleylpyruvate isomerase family mycothiol-dependent enzyme [Pseudonocardia sp.]
MNASRESFGRRADAFGAVVGTLGAAQWSAPSPCAGWSGADLVDHVIDTERDFLTGHDIDLGPRPAGDPAARWAAHRAALLDKVDDTVLEREYDGYFGRTTVGATLSDVYGFDLVVHRWDLARAAGAEAAFTDAEMDGLEASIALFG